MEDVGIFYGHLVHFLVFCYILWTFGIVRGKLVYFPRFGILSQEKSGNPEQISSVFFHVDTNQAIKGSFRPNIFSALPGMVVSHRHHHPGLRNVVINYCNKTAEILQPSCNLCSI
jgi:hypothetical protein